MDWWNLLLGAFFTAGWSVQVVGWAPYSIAIYIAGWCSDILVIIAGWFLAASDFFERRQLGYEDPDIHEWAFYYEYNDWLERLNLPVPRILQLRIAYINQHLVQ